MDNLSVSSDDMSDSETMTFGEPGLLIKDKYLLIKKIGDGAFSSVWLTYEYKNDKFVVLKIQNADDYDVGVDEVNILKKINNLKSNYFTKLLDYFEYESDDYDEPFVIMVFELMVGSLQDIMENDYRYKTGFSLSFVQHVATTVLTGIDLLRKELNIVHTDIKPENILLKGRSGSVQNIINKFKEFKFKDKLIKNKKKKKKTYLELTIKQMLDHMKETIGYCDSSDSDSDSISDSESITIFDSDSDINSMCGTENNTSEYLDDKYIINKNIQIGDFGNFKKNKINEEIQTRYYRAPEVLLGIEPYNYTVDVWSTGCLLFEIATGKILYNPQKFRGINRDRDHLYLIIKNLGTINKELLKKSSRYSLYFTNKGLLKRREKIEYIPLNNHIERSFDLVYSKEEKGWNKKTIQLFSDFLSKLLVINPEERKDINELLSHQFLKI